MWGSWGDKPDMVAMLIRHGSKIDAVDNDGLTPLAIASQNGKIKAAQALVIAPARTSTRRSPRAATRR